MAEREHPRYMISVAADVVGMHPQTLRIYEQKGLLRPKRTAELGLNLAGVEHVLRLEDELRRMGRRMERLEREMRAAVDEIHRQYKRELVLWQPPTKLARKGE